MHYAQGENFVHESYENDRKLHCEACRGTLGEFNIEKEKVHHIPKRNFQM
jgi:cytidine deaminase